MAAEKGRVRLFALVTYITNEDEIQKTLVKHGNSIRAFGYIFHDKDENDPHFHVVIRTHSNWTPKQIAVWFNDFNEKKQNTLAQPVWSRQGIVSYLTHDDEPDKHHYSQSDIKWYNEGDIRQKEGKDDSQEIVEDILRGVKTREMVKRYGRDYIYHIQAYHFVAEKIQNEEEAEKRWKEACEREARYNVQKLGYLATQNGEQIKI